MKRPSKRQLIITMAVMAIIGATVVASLYSTLYSTGIRREGVLYIPTGATFETVVDSLTNGDAKVRSTAKFRSVASMLGYGDKIKSGRYVIPASMSYISLVRTLRAGHQAPVRVTFNNIRTLDQLAGRLSHKIETDSLTLLKVLRSDSVAKAMGYTPQTLISMFIPNTYEVYWNASPEALLQRMKGEHDRFWNDNRRAKLADTGLSEVEAMTIASIVYEETKQVAEMPTVAGVYINRLRVKMPLQADPTVKFAMGDFALRRVLHKHLSIDSPYNTYKYAGLPPGPICMPSIAAIDAVLNHQKHHYIYFCAAADLSGRHKFAATLAEHGRNAREYAAALNNRRIFK